MPKITTAWDTYDGYIVDKRKAGATLEEIGKEVGVTRERVRQILVEHYGTAKRGKPASLFTTAELAQLASLATPTINSYRKRGIIKSTNASVTYPLYSVDALKAISAFRQCRICGRPLPNGKWSYCSPECSKVGNYKAQKRGLWRMLRRKRGQPITPSIAYERRGYG